MVVKILLISVGIYIYMLGLAVTLIAFSSRDFLVIDKPVKKIVKIFWGIIDAFQLLFWFIALPYHLTKVKHIKKSQPP